MLEQIVQYARLTNIVNKKVLATKNDVCQRNIISLVHRNLSAAEAVSFFFI